MSSKNQFLSWLIFILFMAGGYVFMIFFMEGITADLFHVEKKKVHFKSVADANEKVDKKAEVTIDKASMNYLKDSVIVKEGKEKIIRVDSGEPLTGIKRWSVEMFNDMRLTYSLLVTALMATIGVIIGFFTDFILKLFGFTVSKIAHHE